MKITREYLKRVIKEELERAVSEMITPDMTKSVLARGNTAVHGLHLLNDLKNNRAIETYKMLVSAGMDPQDGTHADAPDGEYELKPTDSTKTEFNLYPIGNIDRMPINAQKGFIHTKDLKSVRVY